MDLILVTENREIAQPLIDVAEKEDHRILKLIGTNQDVSGHVQSLCPDVLIFVSDEIDNLVLRQMKTITDKRATPMILFTRDSQSISIDAAVKAGATAYVVNCSNPERLNSLIDVARSRFADQQQLKVELLNTRQALNDRKTVEKAKGIIMQTKNLSEEQAYTAIRKLAMNHNKRIGEIAEQIISAAEVLV